MSESQMKTALTTLYNIKGIVHFEFIPQGQIFSEAYYVEIVKWLQVVCQKRPELWSSNWILHHDNAPPYKMLSVKQFLV